MPDDDFALWLGRIGQDRPLQHRMRAAVNRAGGRMKATRSSFTGVRIGRGAGVGAMLSSPSYSSGASGRRVIVKASIVKLGGKGLGGATAHLRYLQRDGTTREGKRGELYGPGEDSADGKAFLDRGAADRHQFRFIVAPEDGAEYEDLKPLVRRWMDRVEQDLGTKLDWVAVDHFNTGHPHSHVIVRGKDERGKDLVIARSYLTHGLRGRAAELVDLDLGPRSTAELLRAAAREVDQERLTGIDRRLLRAVGEDGIVPAAHRDGVEQSLRAGRLQVLERMGLAEDVGHGRWKLAADLEPTLRRMGERNDIIRTMQRELRAHVPERTGSDMVIHDPVGHSSPVVGKVVARGLSDEHADRHYLIVDGTDGISRYIDIGLSHTETPAGSVVRVSPTPAAVRQVDRTIAEVAGANGGRYGVEEHLAHDPTATEAFAQTHVRRLEAIRRATGGVERQADGSWIIAPDHLQRVEAYERQRASQTPVRIEMLSPQPVERLPTRIGVTWLDRELVADKPSELGRGFGVEVRRALLLRQQWLIEQDLLVQDGDRLLARPNLLASLQQRELRNVAAQLSRELGLPFQQSQRGDYIEGVCRKAVTVGDSRFAVVERARDFTLVPWRAELEQAVGKQVSGIMRDTGHISWTIGRGRSGPSIG